MNEDDELEDDLDDCLDDEDSGECAECGGPIHDEDEEDDDYVPDFCMICEDREVPYGDRWKFKLVDETGEEDPEWHWICRTCHSKFNTVDEFEAFRRNHTYSRLYRIAERLQRMLLLKAPASIIADTVFCSLAGVLFLSDEMGGSEEMRSKAKEELAKRVSRNL